MVIDVAKGVEDRTRKLMEVCRLRDTPIITFINKLDREGKDGIDLLVEIESELGIECVPITWPIGLGPRLNGIYHLDKDSVRFYSKTDEEQHGKIVEYKNSNNALNYCGYQVEELNRGI